MRALTFHAPEDVRCEQVPEPALLEPGDVIVRVEAAGLCGSDLHPYFGRETGLDPGTVLGHEMVGTVVEVGAGVERWTPGDRVVCPFTTSCGRCFYCRRGLTCRCPEGRLFGWVEDGVGLQGAQAELLRVPLADSTLVRLPEGLDPAVALLAGDVLPTGLFGVDLLGLDSAHNPAEEAVVAVVGCGPVGLAAVVGLCEMGIGRIVAVDRVPERLSAARALGAEPVDTASGSGASEEAGPEPVEAVRALTSGRGADGVIEAVGSPGASRLAVGLLRPGGTLAAVGVHTEASFPFSPAEAYDLNLTFRAGRCPARRYTERSLEILVAGRYPLDALVTHRLPLSDGPEAYRMFGERRDGVVKVAFDPAS